MSPSDLALYTNLGLIALFVLICLGVFFAAVRGYKKGIFHTTYKVIFFAVLFLIGIFSFQPIVELIGNIDLSFLPWKTIIITSPDATATAYVPITNLFETLENSLAAFGLFYNYTGSVTEILEFATALATTIIKTFTFIIMMILILTLGVLLRIVLWHLIFKRLIPKAVYKTVKLPWISMLENAVKFLVIGFLFLTPFTSMVNILNQAHQRNKVEQEQSEIIDYLTVTLDTYNNSIFANTFFNWTASGDGVTFDVEVFDALTKSTLEDGSVSLIGEIQNLSDLGYTLFVTLFADGNFDMGDITGGLTTDMIQLIFSTLAGSPTIMYLLPMALELVFNSDVLSDYVDTGLIKMDDIRWEDELENVEYMLCDIAESGILSMFIDENGEFISPDTTMMIETLFSKESHPYISSIFERIDDSKLLTRAICSLVNMLEISLEGESLLPSSWDEINEIKWGIELKTVYDCLYRVTQYSPDLIDFIMSSTNQPRASVRYSEDSPFADPSELISIIVDCLPILKDVLIGSTNSRGEPINVDSNGRTIVFDSNGKKIPGREYCLADSNLFKYLLPSVSKMLVNALPSDEIDFSAVEDAIDELNHGKIIANYKREFGIILKALEPLTDGEEAIDLISNFDKVSSPSDISPEVADALGKTLQILDNSMILSKAMKNMVKSLLTSGEIATSLKEFGLDTNKFNFDCENFGKEISNLLKIFPDVSELMTVLDSSSEDTVNLMTQLGQRHLNIANIFDAIISNQIINPDELNDQPFLDTLESIFNNAGISDLGIEIDFDNLPKNIQWENHRDINGDIITDKFGNPVYTGESGKIANAIKVIGETGIMNIIDMDITSNIGSLERDYKISKVIKSLAASEIFKIALPAFLDAQIESTNLIDKELNISFSNVTDWNLEADNFGKLILAIDELGLDFGNLDFKQLTSPENIRALNRLLHVFENSQIFDNGNESCFSSFLYSKIKSALGSTGDVDLFADPVIEGQPKTYEIFKSDMESIVSSEWSNSAYWVAGEYVGNEEDFYTCDELGKLCNIIKQINDSDILNKDLGSFDFTNPPITSETLEDVLLSVNNATEFRIVIYNMFEVISKNAQTDVISFESANNEYLLYPITSSGITQADIDERAVEIGYLINLFDVFVNYSSTILDGSTFDITSIDSDFVNELETILLNLNKSYVYHRAGIDETKHELTVFQSLINAFIGSGDISNMFYSESSPKDYYYYKNLGVDNAEEKQQYLLSSIFSYNPSVSDYDSQEQEIYNIVNVLKAFIGAEDGKGGYYNGVFVKNPDGTFGPQFNFGSDIFYVTGERTDPRDENATVPINNVLGMQQVLEQLTQSRLLQDCAPNAIGNSFGSHLNASLSSGTYINIDHINPFYIYYSGAGFTWNNTFDADEIEFLTYLIQQMANYIDGNDATETDIPTDFTKISKDDLSKFNNFLNQVASSKMLHLGGPTYTVHEDGSVSLNNNSLGYATTFYQDIFLEILNRDGIREYYYNINSPKDVALYSDGIQTKIRKAVIEQQLNYLDSSIDYEQINDSLVSVFESLFDTLNISDLSSFSGFDVSTIDTSKLYDLLMSLDNNDILYDMVPNILSESFDSLASDASFAAFKRVTFEGLDPYYLYTKYTSTPDYSRRYSDDLVHDELHAITTIIDTSIGPDGLLKALDAEAGHTLNSDDLSLSILTDENILKLQIFLDSLHDSYITHRYHPNHFDGDFDELDTYTDSLQVSNLLKTNYKGTIFEEFVVTFLDVLHLSDFAFDVDFSLGQADYYGPYDADATYSGHILKSLYEIKRLTIHEEKPYLSTYKGVDSNWKAFNENFMTFIRDFRDFMDTIGKTDFNIIGSDLVNIEPETLIRLIAEMNSLDLVNEASNRLLRTVYTTMNFPELSSIDIGSDTIDFANYYISQDEMGYVNNQVTPNTFTGELKSLSDFIVHFYVPGVGYSDMQSLLDLSSINPATFEIVLRFLDDSSVYGTKYEFYNNLYGFDSTANGIIFTKIATPIAYYLTGFDFNEKMLTASNIFLRNDFEPSEEAEQIITLFAATAVLNSYVDLGSINSILIYKDIISTILDLGSRSNSIFAKDAASNILDAVVEAYEYETSSYDKGMYTTPSFAPALPEDVIAYQYNKLTISETDAFKGATNLATHFAFVNSHDSFVNKFNQNYNDAAGNSYSVSQLFDLMDSSEGKSYIACLIYQTQIKPYVDYAGSVSVSNIFTSSYTFSELYSLISDAII